MKSKDTIFSPRLAGLMRGSHRHLQSMLLAGVATMTTQVQGDGDCSCLPESLMCETTDLSRVEATPCSNGLLGSVRVFNLCSDSDFSSLEAAIDQLMADPELNGMTVVLQVPGKVYGFTTTIDLEFDSMGPSSLQVIAKDPLEVPVFKNEIETNVLDGRRMFHSSYDGSAGGVPLYLHFKDISFVGNQDFDATAAGESLPSTTGYFCGSGDDGWGWEYRTGIEVHAMHLVAIGCEFKGFASQLYKISTESHEHSLDGAAIYVRGHGCLKDCTFTDNYAGDLRILVSAEQDVYCSCGEVPDEYCFMKDNSSAGAVYHDASSNINGIVSDLVVENSTFVSNVARDMGGAIRAAWSGNSTSQLNVEGSRFIGNFVELSCNNNSCGFLDRGAGGGAIAMGGVGGGRIVDSHFEANEVRNGQGECSGDSGDRRWRGRGGAIWANARCEIEDSQFVDNLAHGGTGSAIWFFAVSGEIRNSTIIGSERPDQFGALVGMHAPSVVPVDVRCGEALGDDPIVPDDVKVSVPNRLVDCVLHSRNAEKAIYLDEAGAAVFSSRVKIDGDGPAVLVDSVYPSSCGSPSTQPWPAGAYFNETTFIGKDSGCVAELFACGPQPEDCGHVSNYSYAFFDSCSYRSFSTVLCDGDGAWECPSWTATMNSCVADFNGDGVVNGGDLAMLLGDWGLPGSPYDVSGDGALGGADLSVMLGTWGPCF